MRVTLLVFVTASALIALTSAHSLGHKGEKRSGFVALSREDTKQCDGVQCQLGCCPFEDYVCCKMPGCAPTVEECNDPDASAVLRQLIKPSAVSGRQCDGVECPGGCCPEQGWFCCEDGIYCAAVEADCLGSKMNKVHKAKPLPLIRRENRENRDCEGTECPAGCRLEEGWFCCPDNVYCAAYQDDCTTKRPAEKLIQMAGPAKPKMGRFAPKKMPYQCDGTECPSGCCPEVNWTCCPDNVNCAATLEDCP